MNTAVDPAPSIPATDTPTIDALFAPAGPVAARFGPDFEPRPQQLEMARAVARALESRSRLLVEAGTGVGKSFAYLLPAVQRIVASAGAERVVVATNTIALQEQLLNKDVPLLQSVFNPEGWDDPDRSPAVRAAFVPELVKGRGNYLSIRRLKLASERQDRLFADAALKRTLHAVEDWAYHTADGTLASLPQLERPAVWDRVQSDTGNCMGRRCPSYEQCFYQTARRRMERANLLICNHALFFSDLALRARAVGFLPPYDHVILDEAHAVEDSAAEFFGVTLSESRVKHLLSSLFNPAKGKGLVPALRSVTDESARDAAVRAVMEADAASRDYFENVVTLCSGRRGAVRVPNLAAAQTTIFDNHLTPAFKTLALALKNLKGALSAEEDKYEVNAFVDRADTTADAAEILCEQQFDGFAYWAECSTPDDSARGFGVRATLACAPIEVAPILKEHLFSQKISAVLTSATLTTSRASFDHAAARIGAQGADTLVLGSPFDHAAQAELHVDATIPDPRAPDYAEALADRTVEHLAATDGGAFVLFTSFNTMHDVLNIARHSIERMGLPLWVHGKDGSREHILTEFRKDERSVLFGTASFWQGVDVRGRALRNVIITRLPFDPPDRPLTQARLDLIQARGGNPFMEDSLPRAVIKFKQGFGRLIRSASDKGRVVVLDPRIVTARYGRLFIDSLPEGVRVIRKNAPDAAEF